MRGLVLMIAFLAVARPSGAGEAVRVIDGVETRLWGIDAVELRQECGGDGGSYPCGLAARDALARLVAGKTVACEKVSRDCYGRTVARCAAPGVDLGGEMVWQGWAVDFPRYSRGYYADRQVEARTAGRGLWRGSFTPPAAWRRNHQ